MKRLNAGHDTWFVKITGPQDEILFYTESRVSVYQCLETGAYYVYLMRDNGHKLYGIYAGNVTISMRPI